MSPLCRRDAASASGVGLARGRAYGPRSDTASAMRHRTPALVLCGLSAREVGDEVLRSERSDGNVVLRDEVTLTRWSGGMYRGQRSVFLAANVSKESTLATRDRSIRIRS